jgi:hypothetical protein
MLDLHSIIHQQTGIVFRMVGNLASDEVNLLPEQQVEGILILPERGQIKVVNEIGARIWSLIDGQSSIQDIASKITDEYQVGLEDALRDTLVFMKELEERGLVIQSDQ